MGKGTKLSENRIAKINLKLLMVLIGILLVLAFSLFYANRVSRKRMIQKSLKTGQAAFEDQDWPVAVKHLKRFLKKYPSDIDVLKQYAQAVMSIRPIGIVTINAAISAYNGIQTLAPLEPVAYEKLLILYQAIGNVEKAASISRSRIKNEPNDLRAYLWLADAQTGMNKTKEATSTLENLLRRTETLGEKDTYVQACIKMSQILITQGNPQSDSEDLLPEDIQTESPLDWLNRAVAYAPDSVEALVYRAQYYIGRGKATGLLKYERNQLVRQDLESADVLDTDDARVLLMMGGQWLVLDEPDRASAELQKANQVPQEKLEEYYFDLSRFIVGNYLLAAEIEKKRGDFENACVLTDKILDSLQSKGYRSMILPTTISLYVLGGQVDKARASLDEYLELLKAQQGEVSSVGQIAALQVLVASAEGNPAAALQVLELAVDEGTDRPAIWRMMALAYEQTNQVGSAINALERYLQIGTQDAEAMTQLARLYARAGNWASTVDMQEKAEAFGLDDIRGKVLRIGAGVNLAVGPASDIDLNGLAGLSVELSELRQQYPTQIDVRILQAIIANAQAEPEKAEQELRKAIAECQEPIKAELQLVDLYRRTKRLPEAIKTCRGICQRHSDTLRPWISLSTLHVMNQDYASARECLTQGRGAVTDPSTQRVLSARLAIMELVYGERIQGIELLQELAKNNPKDIQARRYLLGIKEIRENAETVQRLIAELRIAEGEDGVFWRLHQASLWLTHEQWESKQQDIKEMLERCVSSDDTWSTPVLLLAEMYAKMGDMKQVEEVYQQALDKNPSATVIAERLLALLERQERFSQAEQILRMIGSSLRTGNAWSVRIALGSGDVSRAINELGLQISNNDQDARSRIQLAQLLYQESGDKTNAFRYLREAEAIDPNSRTLTAVKANILNSEGQKADAIKILDDYVLRQKSFEAYWMRAVFLSENDEPERTEQDYQKLLTFTDNGEAGYELLSNYYAGTDRLEQAIAAVEEGLEAYPEGLTLKRVLMRLLYLRGREADQDRAVTILRGLEQQLPGDTELMIVRAQRLLQNITPETLQDARRKLELAIRQDPAEVLAYLMLINIAMYERDYENASEVAMQGVRYNPNNPALLLARARAEMALEYYQVATDLALRVLRRDIKNSAAFALALQGAISNGNTRSLDEILALINAQIGIERENGDLWIARAQVLVSLKRPLEAIPELKAYCQSEESAQNIPALTVLADLYRMVGDFNKSNESIQKAEQLAPKHQAVVHARFMWLIAQDRYEELKQISSAYIKADEQELTKVLRAAYILLSCDAGELKTEAVHMFEHAVSLAPASRDARLGLASSLYQTGNAEEAVRILQEWLKQDPTSARTLNDLSWILQEKFQRFDEALELVNRAINIVPTGLHLLDTRAQILSQLEGQLEEARTDFEQIQRLTMPGQPRLATNLLKLGRVCFKLNDFAKTKQHLEQALALDEDMKVFTSDQHQEIADIIGKMKEEEK